MSWQDRFILALATAFRNEQQQTGCITGLLLTQQPVMHLIYGVERKWFTIIKNRL